MNTLKAFRGTLLALVAFLVVAGAWWLLRPPPSTPPAKDKAKQQEGVALFKFEKSELVAVKVVRPEGTITLVEKPDGWWIEGENLRAAKSMVNRVKHQLHDLVSRATVVEDAQALALYGLGEGATHVTLTFRDGTQQSFDAGDPNPSGVSFYIRPLPGEAVYTVKKSAVDYYTLSLVEFRERRFASFDSKDVDALEAVRADGVRLLFQRTADHAWELLSPQTFPADDDAVRSLMGRVSALKAINFAPDDETDLAKFGLDHPRLTVTLRFAARPPLTLLVGGPTGEKDGEYPLAYAKIADESSVYAIRDGLLEDYNADPQTFRLTRFVEMDGERIAQIVATWADPGRDKDLNGTVTVRMAANTWQWDDGVPVPGSTPKRVASKAASVDSESYVSEVANDALYGFDHPLVRLELLDLDGARRTLLVGKAAPAVPDRDGNDRDRYYARVDTRPDVYIIDAGVVEVTRDLMREHRRKATGDVEEEVRHDQIEKEMGPPDRLKPPWPDRNVPPGRRPRPGTPSPEPTP